MSRIGVAVAYNHLAEVTSGVNAACRRMVVDDGLDLGVNQARLLRLGGQGWLRGAPALESGRGMIRMRSRPAQVRLSAGRWTGIIAMLYSVAPIPTGEEICRTAPIHGEAPTQAEWDEEFGDKASRVRVRSVDDPERWIIVDEPRWSPEALLAHRLERDPGGRSRVGHQFEVATDTVVAPSGPELLRLPWAGIARIDRPHRPGHTVSGATIGAAAGAGAFAFLATIGCLGGWAGDLCYLSLYVLAIAPPVGAVVGAVIGAARTRWVPTYCAGVEAGEGAARIGDAPTEDPNPGQP